MMTRYKIEASGSVAKMAMDVTADIDRHRFQLADRDPLLNDALLNIEMDFLNGARRMQRKLTNPWEL